MEQEIWKDCVGYEGFYQVSNLGRVRSLDRKVLVKYKNRTEVRSIKGKILNPSMCHGGLNLTLCGIDGRMKEDRVHNLVLGAFIGKRPNGYEACHFPDNSYTNNRLDNLRWDTKKKNERDKRYIGTDCRGERHGMVKITTDTALKIKKMLLNHGPKYVSDNLNVKINIVSNIKYGRSWSWLKV